MEFFGELLVEFLTRLADFDEKKHPPFGIRYWLGWLGLLTNLLMLFFLTFVTLVFSLMFAEGRGWSFLVLALLFMPILFFWLYKTLGFIRKMWHITLYYRKISKNIS
ncbi:hypothetical protein [Streptococcus suis]|uniref:hypothetical protein n=1 Tax=Streptococcus suis TaxID=1307 RepID=UPI000CF3ED95|nr:hypothetical protein [Streptococcus suis]